MHSKFRRANELINLHEVTLKKGISRLILPGADQEAADF